MLVLVWGCRTLSCAHIRFIGFLLRKLALTFQPLGIEARSVGEDGPLLALCQTAHGQTQFLLAALDGPNFLPEIGRNLLPGVEAVVGWSVVLQIDPRYEHPFLPTMLTDGSRDCSGLAP